MGREVVHEEKRTRICTKKIAYSKTRLKVKKVNMQTFKNKRLQNPTTWLLHGWIEGKHVPVEPIRKKKKKLKTYPKCYYE